MLSIRLFIAAAAAAACIGALPLDPVLLEALASVAGPVVAFAPTDRSRAGASAAGSIARAEVDMEASTGLDTVAVEARNDAPPISMRLPS